MSEPVSTGFTRGGKVQAGGGLYIKREADDALLRVCRAGEIGVVLHSRQVGKSSLIGNVSATLNAEGIATALVDLTRIGTKEVTVEQWYLSVLDEICRQLGVSHDVVDWWDDSKLTYVHRMSRFFDEVLLKHVTGKVVIFIDEVDTTLALDFSDDFFAAVREMYQARDRTERYKRVSFVFAGSSSPDDLMRDKDRTPFNIGTQVDLKDFTLEESYGFAPAFQLDGPTARKVLGWVHAWTNGHPYLTQELCALIAERLESEAPSEELVERIVADEFFGAKGSTDKNLSYVREMLTTRVKPENHEALVRLYQRIAAGRRVPPDAQSPLQAHLRLAGIVIADGDALRVRNLIYARVFDRRWIAEQLPVNWRAIGGASAAVALCAFLGAAYYVGFIKPVEERKLAEQRAVDRWQTTFVSTADEEEALTAFNYLSGATPEPSIGRALEGNQELAHALLDAFWKRRAASIQERAEASDRDARYLLYALAATKPGGELPPSVAAQFASDYAGTLVVLRGHYGAVDFASFGPHGDWLATGSRDDTIRLWMRSPSEREGAAAKDTGPWAHGEVVSKGLSFELDGKPHRPRFVRVARAGGDTYLLATSNGGLVRVWQGAPAQARAVLDYSTYRTAAEVQVTEVDRYDALSLDLSHDASRLLITGTALELLALTKGDEGLSSRRIASARDSGGPTRAWDGRFAPDGRRIVTASANGYLLIWDADMKRAQHKVNVPRGAGEPAPQVNSIAFAGDGARIVAGATNATAVVIDAATLAVRSSLVHPEGSVSFAQFCVEGEPAEPAVGCRAAAGARAVLTVSATSGGRSVHCWEVNDDGKASQVQPALRYADKVLAVDPTCRYAATVAPDASEVKLRQLWAPEPTYDAAGRLTAWQDMLQKRVGSADTVSDMLVGTLELEKR